uniref:Death domain-containing protein n=1 Tax=Globodera pallida TaxID=36090 RepID=A0A183BXY1_GLOPA
MGVAANLWTGSKKVDQATLTFLSQLMHFPGAHDNINITAQANSMLQAWEINPEKVHVFLRDWAAAMKKVMQLCKSREILNMQIAAPIN